MVNNVPALPFKLGGRSGRMVLNKQRYAVAAVDLLENAEFIVRACNSHYDNLAKIEVLEKRNKELTQMYNQKQKHVSNLLKKKRSAAIAKAEGK